MIRERNFAAEVQDLLADGLSAYDIAAHFTDHQVASVQAIGEDYSNGEREIMFQDYLAQVEHIQGRLACAA